MNLRIRITKKQAAAAARSIDAVRRGDACDESDAVIADGILRRVLAALPELFARKKKGICFVCGCSECDPCENGCAWVDRSHTLCSACVFVNVHHPDAPIPYRITQLGQRMLEKHRKEGRS